MHQPENAKPRTAMQGLMSQQVTTTPTELPMGQIADFLVKIQTQVLDEAINDQLYIFEDIGETVRKSDMFPQVTIKMPEPLYIRSHDRHRWINIFNQMTPNHRIADPRQLESYSYVRESRDGLNRTSSADIPGPQRGIFDTGSVSDPSGGAFYPPPISKQPEPFVQLKHQTLSGETNASRSSAASRHEQPRIPMQQEKTIMTSTPRESRDVINTDDSHNTVEKSLQFPNSDSNNTFKALSGSMDLQPGRTQDAHSLTSPSRMDFQSYHSQHNNQSNLPNAMEYKTHQVQYNVDLNHQNETIKPHHMQDTHHSDSHSEAASESHHIQQKANLNFPNTNIGHNQMQGHHLDSSNKPDFEPHNMQRNADSIFPDERVGSYRMHEVHHSTSSNQAINRHHLQHNHDSDFPNIMTNPHQMQDQHLKSLNEVVLEPHQIKHTADLSFPNATIGHHHLQDNHHHLLSSNGSVYSSSPINIKSHNVTQNHHLNSPMKTGFKPQREQHNASSGSPIEIYSKRYQNVDLSSPNLMTYKTHQDQHNDQFGSQSAAQTAESIPVTQRMSSTHTNEHRSSNIPADSHHSKQFEGFKASEPKLLWKLASDRIGGRTRDREEQS